MDAIYSTCHAHLVGRVKEKPVGNFVSVEILFELLDLDESRHKRVPKSVKNYGALIRGDYDGKSALVLHQENVRKTTEMFKIPKGCQFTSNAARCGKYRKNLRNKLSSCPYTSLSYLKHSSAYSESIQSISIEPFCTMYCSPNQLKIYKAYHQQNNYTKMSCDATGGVVNKLSKSKII